MSMSRFLVEMATVASLMFNLACEEVDATCTGSSCQNQAADATNSSPDGSVNAGDHGSIDTSEKPDTSPGDQSVVEVAADVNSDPCAEWRWMEAYKWQCPGNLNSDIKFTLNMQPGKCHATSKVFDLPASELTCDKTKKEFSYFEPQVNETIHCVIIK